MLSNPKRLVLSLALALSLGAIAFAQDGESVFNSNCAACHQGNGQGIPSAFPPLAQGHVPDLLAVEGGRAYLINVLLYGLAGEITVAGQTYNGAMPAWSQLSDEQIAAVLNFIASGWDNETPEDFEPYTAEEVAAERDKGLSTAEVIDMRGELPLGEDSAD